jgi:hypothetical protein
VPDIAILDVNLPDMSGFRVLETREGARRQHRRCCTYRRPHVEVSDRSGGIAAGCRRVPDRAGRNATSSCRRLWRSFATRWHAARRNGSPLRWPPSTMVSWRCTRRSPWRSSRAVAASAARARFAVNSPSSPTPNATARLRSRLRTAISDSSLQATRARAATRSEYVVDVGVITSLVMDPYRTAYVIFGPSSIRSPVKSRKPS